MEKVQIFSQIIIHFSFTTSQWLNFRVKYTVKPSIVSRSIMKQDFSSSISAIETDFESPILPWFDK